MRGNVTATRKRALFSLFNEKTDGSKSFGPSFSFFVCHRQAEAKNFSRSDALVFKNFHSSSFPGKIKIASKHTTRFWFLRSSFASRAIYKKRKRDNSRVDTPTKRKRTAEKTSRSLELALRGFQSRDKFKNERERERGFIIENSKIQERNAQQKKSSYYY